jgi:hypothetical protein
MIDWNEEFTEQVVGFSSTPHFIELKFSVHAAIFSLRLEREDFVPQMTNIARAFKANTPVKVQVNGQEVLSVSEPPPLDRT